MFHYNASLSLQKFFTTISMLMTARLLSADLPLDLRQFPSSPSVRRGRPTLLRKEWNMAMRLSAEWGLASVVDLCGVSVYHLRVQGGITLVCVGANSHQLEFK